MNLASWSFLIQNLKEVLDSNDASIAQLQYQIESVHGNILSFWGKFADIEEQPRKHELKHAWTRFKDIVYPTEYFIDSITFRDEPVWCCKLAMFDVIEEIKLTRKEVNDTVYKTRNDTAILKFAPTVSGVLPQASSGKIVHCRDQMEWGICRWSRSWECLKLVKQH